MDELHLKKARLEEILKDLGSVAVAFSAGVDCSRWRMIRLEKML